MKTRFIQLATASLLVLGAAGCAEKKATVTDLAVQADATAPAGAIISSAQAVEWTRRFQAGHPHETWETFTEAKIFTQLLGQKDCQGLRIYNGTEASGVNTFVLVGVDSQGADLSAGLVADDTPKGPPCSYNSILVTESAAILPPTLPAGAFIPLDQAASMTHRYQASHANGMRGSFFSADVYAKLLAQPGCIGIRIYNGLKEDKSECHVLVGVRADGSDLTDGLLYDMGTPCPPVCKADSPLT